MSKQDIYLQRAAQLVITRDKITTLEKEQYEIIEKSPVIHKIRHEMLEAASKENWEELLEPLKKKEELASKEVAKEINNELITLEKQLEKEIAHCLVLSARMLSCCILLLQVLQQGCYQSHCFWSF